ncbi:hypothetical protein [Pseudomonas putida]|uniref:AbiU2 domain-containing protein n=1 Tax=Pseudomonas putida TaxID=303 RepID=UPI002363BBE5|nr:hypothetical protein [Pseudomonas putida]MDD1989982.1 hypothetical protein [Pseudomonas putida]HDS1796130.1 hypothetical protein [Pseudomonas putida]
MGNQHLALLREKFDHFRKECIWITNCYNLYRTLYEGGEATDAVLLSVAPAFFHDLNRIIVEHIILQICKITDPAGAGHRQNLTVDSLNKDLKSLGLLSQDLIDQAVELERYRDLIMLARNKLISHLDWQSVREGESLGEHEAGEVSRFFASLFQYTDLVGEACGAGPLDYSVSACQGDAIDLLRALRISVQT